MTHGKLIATSQARDWQALHRDILDLYAAARHRLPRADHWRIDIILGLGLLPVDPASAGLMALHAELDEADIPHAVHAHHAPDDSEPRHRLIFQYAHKKNRPGRSKSSAPRHPPSVYPEKPPAFAKARRRPINLAPETTMPDFTIRPTPQTTTQTQETAAMPNDRHHEIAKLSLWSRLEALIFGAPHDPWQEARVQDTPPDLIPQPPMSWLQAFNNALTDATASFIRDYVAPLHTDDPQTGFLLRSIEVAIPDDTLSALRVIAEMPAETRNRIAQTRCIKAHGAKEQLVFDQFYGLNVVAADTLVDGFLLRTLVATEGSRLNLTFRFSGDYVSLPEAAADPIPDEMVIPDTNPALHLVRDNGSGTRIRPPRPVEAHKGTRIRPPRNDSSQPLFYLTILEKSGEQRVPVDLKMLPLTIGTAPRHGKGVTLHPGSDTDNYVSSEHLEIVEFNPATQLLYVNNKGRNGTYEGGTRLSERFTLKPANKKLLTLGGPEGEEGVAQVRIEAA